MEDGTRQMDMVRLPREEKLYDREAILGRDVSSVFPTKNEGAERASAERAKLAVGAARFVSESQRQLDASIRQALKANAKLQLEELRAQTGNRGDEGTAPDKPLAQVLEEAKQAKEDKFKAVWQSMKQGKNRPLDDDELDFVNELLEQERSKDRLVASEELKEMDAYREAVKLASERRATTGPVGPSAPARKAEEWKTAPVRKPQFTQIVRTKADKESGQSASTSSLASSTQRQDEPAAKRAKASAALVSEVERAGRQPKQEQQPAGLESLLGGYESGSESH